MLAAVPKDGMSKDGYPALQYEYDENQYVTRLTYLDDVYESMSLRGFRGEFYYQKKKNSGLPSLIYLLVWAAALILLGADRFMIPSMAAIIFVLLARYGKEERSAET